MANNDVLTVAATSGNTYETRYVDLGERPHDVLWTVDVGGTLQGVATVMLTGDSRADVDAGTARWFPYTSFLPTGTLTMNAAVKTRDYIDAGELNGSLAKVSFAATSGAGALNISVKAKQR